MRRPGASKGVLAAVVIIIIVIIAAAAALSYKPAPSKPTTPTTTKPTTTTTNATQKQAQKKYADVITIGTTDKVSDLDPASAYDFFTWEVFYNTMEAPFGYVPGTTKLEKKLITSYEVKDDGKVYILHLRKDLKFDDGTPCTAKDLKWSIERVAKIQGDPSWFVLDFVKDVKVLDTYTLEIDLNKPVSFYPAVLAVPTYAPIPPDKYPPDKISPDNTAGGVGPYKIVKFVRDQELILQANPYYYGTPPKTKTVVIKFYKDATALRLALQSGEIDIAWRTLNPSDIISLKKNPDYKVWEGAGSYIRYIVFNTKIPPLNNKLVRQALAAALDRQSIVQKVFLGTVEPLYSLVPMGMWSHKDSFKDKYGAGPNLELAKELLKKAGYSESHKLKITLWYTPSHYGSTEADVASLIKEAWEKTGMVEVTIKSAEWSTYLELTRKGQLPVTLYGWYPDYLDPDDYLYPFLHTGANRWLGNPFSNSTVDKLLDQAQVETSQTKRAQLYEEVQDILADQAWIVPIFQGKLYAVSKKSVGGIVLDPMMLLRYYLIYKQVSG